jgi:magnesium chelatase family protein
VQRYQQRISGPFWDRIDLVVPVHPVSSATLSAGSSADSSAFLRERIAVANQRQVERLVNTGWRRNSEISADGGAIDRLLVLRPEAERLLSSIGDARRLSPRARHRMRRVARTIGDLSGDGEELGVEAVARAAHLRRLPELSD